jgi:hypothetical protein
MKFWGNLWVFRITRFLDFFHLPCSTVWSKTVGGASVSCYTSSQIVFHFFALVFIHLVLLARFVAQISTSVSTSFFLIPRMCALYHNFYCIFSGYLPLNWPGFRWLNSCVNLTGVVQWLKLALSKGPNWVGVFTPTPEDGNSSRNVVFSSS